MLDARFHRGADGHVRGFVTAAGGGGAADVTVRAPVVLDGGTTVTLPLHVTRFMPWPR